ncbi:E3 SUMO-protein ligase NSE2 [Andrena cerasifolii]|uniref:E3 SUMO-protein ligase NSE2 n=1 Tax=Andrena cerasifolii TaxID=2819439 RepID=UPI0040382FC6
MTQSQQVIEELYDCYTTTAANIISYYGAAERKTKLKELREIVQNNCLQDKKLKSAELIKEQFLSVYNDDDDETQTDIEAITREYTESISKLDTNVSNDEKLLLYDRQLEALLDKVANEENDEDADLQVSGGLINVIDPISKKRIVDPVKNSICGHTYDRESITEILKINKKTRCPVVGCKSKEFVTLAHLRTDIVTRAYLEKNHT